VKKLKFIDGNTQQRDTLENSRNQTLRINVDVSFADVKCLMSLLDSPQSAILTLICDVLF